MSSLPLKKVKPQTVTVGFHFASEISLVPLLLPRNGLLLQRIVPIWLNQILSFKG